MLRRRNTNSAFKTLRGATVPGVEPIPQDKPPDFVFDSRSNSVPSSICYSSSDSSYTQQALAANVRSITFDSPITFTKSPLHYILNRREGRALVRTMYKERTGRCFRQTFLFLMAEMQRRNPQNSSLLPRLSPWEMSKLKRREP